MPPNVSEQVYNLFTELRKESLEANKMRSQTIGFKITFVSAGMGLIVANLGKVFASGMDSVTDPYYLLLFFIPAFASIFFDLLIISYGIIISRIGLYSRKYLEKNMNRPAQDFKFWEQFMDTHKVRQRLAIIAHVGMTTLVVCLATVVTIMYFFDNKLVLSLNLILILLYFYEWAVFLLPGKIVSEKRGLLYRFFLAPPRLGEIVKKYSKDGRKCKVTFTLRSGAVSDSSSVNLVGDFNSWDRTQDELSKNRKGNYTITLDLECNKEYQFRYLINGYQWENDWNADRYVQNPYGSENSVVSV